MEMNDRFREIRKSLKLTQQAFADSLHVAKPTVAAIEGGNREVTDRMAAEVCHIYGVNEEWLRFGTGEMLAPKSREEEIADFAGEILAGDESDFKFQIIKLLQGMSPEMLAYLREWVENYSNELNKKK